MGDLLEWLGAQLDEDERSARAATPGPWHVRADGVVADDGEHWPVAYTDARLGGADVAHIAARDPARVLREIDAKRQTLTEYVAAGDAMDRAVRDKDTVGYNAARAERQVLERIVRREAVVYADRPGYREEWWRP
ncbi:DUF6221 family protein [Streptomyces griseoviridis]